MSTRLVVPLLGVAFATFLGCHEPPTAPVAVALHLDHGTYVAVPLAPTGTYAFRLVVHYENATGVPIFFDLCNPSDSLPIFGVPTANGRSLSAYDPVWACRGGGPALEFPPGASRTDSLLIEGPTAYVGSEVLGVLTGSFRLEYQTQRCADGTLACAEAGPRVVSAPFQVLLP
jgi:hypothetical protein